MALTGWADNTNYLFRNAAVWPGALGFYVSLWCHKATGLGVDHTPWSLYSTDPAGVRVMYSVSDDFLTHETSGMAVLQPASPHPNATWFHLGGLWMSANQKIYMNAVTPGSSSNTDSAATPTATKIGVHGATNNNPWNGGLAEISVWDTSGMSVANVDALDAKLYNGGAAGAGGNPLNIDAEAAQPWSGKGVAYVLNSANSLTDLFGNGHDFTMQGTLTNFASHPTIEAVSSGGTTPLVGAASLTGIASRMNLGIAPRSMVKIA